MHFFGITYPESDTSPNVSVDSSHSNILALDQVQRTFFSFILPKAIKLSSNHSRKIKAGLNSKNHYTERARDVAQHLLSVPKAPGSTHSQEYKGIMSKKHRCVFLLAQRSYLLNIQLSPVAPVWVTFQLL